MPDNLEKLERLTNLFERGALSKEEFEAQKQLLLQRTASEQSSGSSQPDEPHPDRRAVPWLLYGAPIALFTAVVGGGFTYLDRADRTVDDREIAASGTDTGQSFETAIKFANAASCEPTEGFSDLLDRIALAAAEPPGAPERLVKIPGHPEEFEVDATRSGTGESQVLIARISLKGQWQGLDITELRLARWDDGKTESLQLRFADSALQTTSALKQLGFPILPDGKASRVDGTFIGLERDARGNALVCVRGKGMPQTQEDESATTNQPAIDA